MKSKTKLTAKSSSDFDPEHLTADQKQKLRERFIEYQLDPLLFIKEILGREDHWDKQIEVLKSVADNKFTVVHSGHGVGKSFLSADLVLWFLYSFPNSIVITTAPTWRQVEKVTWGEVRSHYIRSKTPLGGQLLETEIKIGPKHYAVGFSSDTADAFQGFHERNVLVVVEEASGVEDDVLDQIDTLVLGDGCRLIYIGNPVRNTGRFAEAFGLPGWKSIRISCFDTPNVKLGKEIIPGLVTREWVNERKAKWGEDSSIYQSRVLGKPPKESEDTLILMDWLERSKLRYERFTPATKFGNYKPKNIQYSIDVARKGTNKTVHIIRSERRVLEIRNYQGYNLMQTVGVALEIMGKWAPENVIIDDNGVGGGVTDRLVELGHANIVPVNAGERADDEKRFVNRRAELAWRVREAFRMNELDIPDNEDLIFECSHQYYDHTSDYRLRVMSKALLKAFIKKLGADHDFQSPDFFDALCLSYAKSYTGMLAKKQISYLEEFMDGVHIQDIPKEHLEIGVSRYCMLVTAPEESGAYLLWYCADKLGLIYFYAEKWIERATSSNVNLAALKFEMLQPRAVDLRYCEQLYKSEEDKTSRYNLIEQLEDYEMFFEELIWNEELAKINLREGLKFDKTKPVNNLNHPWVYFSPACPMAIRTIKYFSRLQSTKDDPQMTAIHKAVGLAVLAEPQWIPNSMKGLGT